MWGRERLLTALARPGYPRRCANASIRKISKQIEHQTALFGQCLLLLAANWGVVLLQHRPALGKDRLRPRGTCGKSISTARHRAGKSAQRLPSGVGGAG